MEKIEENVLAKIGEMMKQGKLTPKEFNIIKTNNEKQNNT